MANKYRKKANYLAIENKWYLPKYKEMNKADFHRMLFEMAQGTNQAVNQNYKRAKEYKVRSLSMSQLERKSKVGRGEFHASIPENATNRELKDIIDRNLLYLNSIKEGGVKKSAKDELYTFNMKMDRLTSNKRPKGMSDKEWEHRRPFTYEERDKFWAIYNNVTGRNHYVKYEKIMNKIESYMVNNPSMSVEEISAIMSEKVKYLMKETVKTEKAMKDIRRRK